MKKKPIRAGLGKGLLMIGAFGTVALILVVVCLPAVSCGGSTATTQPSMGGTPTTAATTGAGGGTQVVAQGMAFNPATVTVGVGDTVTWTNQDSTTHTVTADGGAFQSASLATGDTFSFTFSTDGTYAYHCSIHPSMKGTVLVQ